MKIEVIRLFYQKKQEMGFADSAIAAIKNNRRLQKRGLNHSKRKIVEKQTFEQVKPKIRLTKESQKRIKIARTRNLMRDVLVLLIVLILSILVMDSVFY